jgi:hypothetical protein
METVKICWFGSAKLVWPSIFCMHNLLLTLVKKKQSKAFKHLLEKSVINMI